MDLKKLQLEAELKEEAHVEALQQARYVTEAELVDIHASFEEASELKYVEGYDWGYVTSIVRWDHRDGWDAYCKMAELKKAKFPIPLSLSDEVLELKESKGTRSSVDSKEKSTTIHPTNS